MSTKRQIMTDKIKMTIMSFIFHKSYINDPYFCSKVVCQTKDSIDSSYCLLTDLCVSVNRKIVESYVCKQISVVRKIW